MFVDTLSGPINLSPVAVKVIIVSVKPGGKLLRGLVTLGNTREISVHN